MAGPYAHFLVLRESLKNLYRDLSLKKYQSIINPTTTAPFFSYACLGAVSPDYPYAAMKLGDVNSRPDENGWYWGDKFHKQNTGNFIDIGLQELRGITNKTDKSFLKKTAWLMGYYSHVITDLVIHAAVYKLVGGCYENHSHDHLHCEVVQDSLLFYDVYSNPAQELVDVHFFRILQKCQEDEWWVPAELDDLPVFDLDSDIKNFWDFIISRNYADFYKTDVPEINDWHKWYSFIMSVGTGVVARTVEPGMAYDATGEIARNDKIKYYSHAILPDGSVGAYKDKVFARAVGEVTARLTAFLKALDDDASYTAFKSTLGAWNMDKGIVADTNPKFMFWDGGITDLYNCHGDPPAKPI